MDLKKKQQLKIRKINWLKFSKFEKPFKFLKFPEYRRVPLSPWNSLKFFEMKLWKTELMEIISPIYVLSHFISITFIIR